MDGGQVDQGAQAGAAPPARPEGSETGAKPGPARKLALSGWPFSEALARLVPSIPAWRPGWRPGWRSAWHPTWAPKWPPWGAGARAWLGLRFAAARQLVRDPRHWTSQGPTQGPSQGPTQGPRQWASSARPYLRPALRGAAWLLAGLAALVLVLAVLYRWVNPPLSMLMLGQTLTGTEIERKWVPLTRISPHLVKAVIVSEDGAFCSHRGVDWHAIRDAVGDGRGGSTITMQVVKNLFLWPSRSYVRKAIEIGLAYLVDALWPKRRILEIYLNIAEWGDGIFGAEAAARAHFAKSAAALSPGEAALMAVALPSPIERSPGSPTAGISRLAGRLQVRMAAARAAVGCVRTGRQREVRPAPVRKPAEAPRPARKGDWDYLFPGGN